jgi:hypothetical protein
MPNIEAWLARERPDGLFFAEQLCTKAGLNERMATELLLGMASEGSVQVHAVLFCKYHDPPLLVRSFTLAGDNIWFMCPACHRQTGLDTKDPRRKVLVAFSMCNKRKGVKS